MFEFSSWHIYLEPFLSKTRSVFDGFEFPSPRWTPFAGMEVVGKLKRVVLRGELVYVDGKVLAEPGFGQDVRAWKEKAITIVVPGEEGSPSKKRPLAKVASSGLDSPAGRPARALSPGPLLSQAPAPPLPVLPGDAQSSLANRHVLKVSMFNKDMLYDIFNLAETFRSRLATGQSLEHVLRGKVMASVFYEVSTRTSCSFSSAMQRLGGSVISMDEYSSSAKKGETIEDSVQVRAGVQSTSCVGRTHFVLLDFYQYDSDPFDERRDKLLKDSAINRKNAEWIFKFQTCFFSRFYF